jgi:hypothetical protein
VVGVVTRHLPASHPVLQRMRRSVGYDEDLDRIHGRALAAVHLAIEARPGELVSASEVADMTARIEDLAQRVVLMPEGPLTTQQRRSLAVIATELIRRTK